VLKNIFPKGYSDFYRHALLHIKQVFPAFDANEFERATLRMIRGGTLFAAGISDEQKRKIRTINRMEDLTRLTPDNGGLQLKDFLEHGVSDLFYAYTVKSLPDGICSFYGKDFNHGLAVLLGLLTAPGLFLQDAEKEVRLGELAQEDLISALEMLETLKGAKKVLLNGIREGAYSIPQAKILFDILLAYGDAFRTILQKADLYDEHLNLIQDLRIVLSDPTDR